LAYPIAPHFLGYSKLGNEITKFAVDWREQIDLGTELPAPSPEEPRYRNLQGPNQWPTESSLPGFRDAFIEYMKQMADMSLLFTSLIAEAIGLPSDAFDKFRATPSLLYLFLADLWYLYWQYLGDKLTDVFILQLHFIDISTE